MDAVLYIASAGCTWRMLPNDFPPVSSVRYYFYGWRDDGVFEMISHILVVKVRGLHGKKPDPTAGVIPSHRMLCIQLSGSGLPNHKNNGNRRDFWVCTARQWFACKP